MRTSTLSVLLITMALAAAPLYAHTQPIIFFLGPNPEKLEPDQWRITAEARPVLQRVISEVHQYKIRYLLVIGHDENNSTPELSYQRGALRADAAKAALIELGLSRDMIVTKSCAFAMTLVNPTGPEPLNRRVAFEGAETLQELLDIDRGLCPEVRPPARQPGSPRP